MLEPVGLLRDGVVHLHPGIGDDLVSHLLESLLCGLLYDSDELLGVVIFGLFQAGLEFGARHISELVRIVLLVSELDGLLQADQDILVAVKLLFELLLASLGLLDLQMERFDIALDLLDPLDDLLFEDFLAPLEITGIFFAAFVAATSIQTGASLQVYCCALDLRLGEHLDVVCISCRSGCAQLV